MTHQRQANTHSFHCDNCPEHYGGDPGEDFRTTWELAREEGWRTYKVGQDWFHRCPVCGEKEHG